jgi:hypothetical protein
MKVGADLDSGRDGMRLVPGVARAVILFQQAREFVPIESLPARAQAGKEFELAACEDRHDNAGDTKSGTISGINSETPAHYILCSPANCLPL